MSTMQRQLGLPRCMQGGGLVLCQELLQTCNRLRRRLLGRALSLQALATKVPADEVDVAVLAAGQAGETGAVALPEAAGEARSDVAWVIHVHSGCRLHAQSAP